MEAEIEEHLFHFKQPAGTSRGVYHTRRSWFIKLTSDEYPGRTGIGECAPLPDLSCDATDNYEEVLHTFCKRYEEDGRIDYDTMRDYPSMLFGLETAERHLKADTDMLFDTPFGHGKEGIPINGLVWMGAFDEMMVRLEEKLRLGFHCVKLKIGAIDFAKEIELIRHVRETYTKEQVELRVDANGGFSPSEAPYRLAELSKYDIHSIEQPIKQHQWSEMARLCQTSPLPIALDEELIGVNTCEGKEELLDTIRPAYIVLKPSLHGGIRGTEEWVSLARERGIGSWITSALESNVGLNAVAHLAAHIYGSGITFPQGLGTGQLFTDNIPMPIGIKGERMYYTSLKSTKV